MVVFGSSGDLATNRLLPAFSRLKAGGQLPRGTPVVGVDRAEPRKHVGLSGFTFVNGDLRERTTYSAVAARVRERGGPSLFYLSTGPALFARIISGLRSVPSGLRSQSRVVIEKPFGTDLKSAVRLEEALGKRFDRAQVFRMDHFLGKAGVRGIARFRFADSRLEGLWNRRHVDCVQVMADEAGGIGRRREFYAEVGVVRDMVQNHLLQLLCLVAMESPGPGFQRGFDAAKVEALRALVPPSDGDAAWGQFRGFEKSGDSRGRRTATFVALNLRVDSPRWRGVPFYVRTGKRLRRSVTEVQVLFKRPHTLRVGRRAVKWDLVRISIDPEPGVSLGLRRRAATGRPGSPEETPIQRGRAQDEYEMLLGEVLRGERANFVSRRFNELAWNALDPLLRSQPDDGSLQAYEPGSWGPTGSDELLSRDGRSWGNPLGD